jgi:hypothetical protein
MNTLPASEIAIGHCVIINDIEAPEGRMVSVITDIKGDVVTTKYLNSLRLFDSYNRRGVCNRRCTVTPVGKFGVSVRVSSDRKYWCEVVGTSSATYLDGTPRKWQEQQPVRNLGRMDLLGLALLQNSEASE